MYDALTVARYIIDRSFRKKDPVSNLRLQKLLYFVQLESYKENNSPMFLDNIAAWQFGPVVPDVYYEYNVYAGTPILLEYKDSGVIKDGDRRIIDKVIDKMKDIPIWKLVDLTHKTGGPWDRVVDNEGYRSYIPKEMIKEEALSSDR